MLGLPEAAEHLQRAGISSLIFDPRSTGQSNGEPRNEIDPFKGVEDISDALTHLAKQPYVNTRQLGLLGMSFGAVVSLCAAALDKRVKFMIAIAPLTDFEFDPSKRRPFLARCIKDRQSQILGNTPFRVPMVTDKGENPVGFGNVDKEKYAKRVQSGKELSPGHVNQTTIQTYYKLFMWQPYSLISKHLDPTSLLFIVPENDITSPSKDQISKFEGISASQKTLHMQLRVGHEDVLVGEHVEELMNVQIRFMRKSLGLE